jgi:uncharacterized protein (DUF433 family)
MPVTLTTRSLPSHIAFDEQGRPWVEGTGRKVVEIAIDHRAGLMAAQIHDAHPDSRPVDLSSIVGIGHSPKPRRNF